MRLVTLRKRESNSSDQYPDHDAPADLSGVLAYGMGDQALAFRPDTWVAPSQEIEPTMVRGALGEWVEL